MVNGAKKVENIFCTMYYRRRIKSDRKMFFEIRVEPLSAHLPKKNQVYRPSVAKVKKAFEFNG